LESKIVTIPKVIPCISIEGPGFGWIILFELIKLYYTDIPTYEAILLSSILNDDMDLSERAIDTIWTPEQIRVGTNNGYFTVHADIYSQSEMCIENTEIDDHINQLYDDIHILIKDIKKTNPNMNSFLEITEDSETNKFISSCVYNCAAKVLNSIEVIHTDALLQVMPFCGIIDRRILITSKPYSTKATYMKILKTGDTGVFK